jgi:hypothetical protein
LHTVYATRYGTERALDFRQHAFVNGAVLNQRLNVCFRQAR